MLLLLNGAPAVGKSTVARRWADQHPLALVVDIDALRTQLGGWQARDETKLVARDLAVALIRDHLATGRDVVVAQQIAFAPFVERLRETADAAGAEFVEIVLTLDVDEATRRFLARRAEHERTGIAHPEFDLVAAEVRATIERVQGQLLTEAPSRGARVIDAADFAWPIAPSSDSAP